MWENSFDINEVREIIVKSNVFLGVGAIEKIDFIAKALKNRQVNKVLVVTGKSSYKITGAWDYVEKALNDNDISYKIYDKVSPNPTTHQVDEAVEIGRNFGAEAVIAIGGGSPIDAGKSAAILLKYTDKNCRELYENNFIPDKAAPVVAINLTHGTGTEADRFAVVSIPETESKPAIGYDCIYPLYSINDPQLTTKLPAKQTLYVSIDALNHVVEASTTTATNPFSITLAIETVRLINKYLPKAIENPEDLEARYYLMYASMIAGISFDNALLHFTHALEHPMSGMKPELSHGLGLAILLPSIIKRIYSAKAEILADVLAPIVPNLEGKPEEAESVAIAMEKWLFSFGVTSKMQDEGFSESDIEKLTNQVFDTPILAGLLQVAPIPADRETIYGIYRESLKPLSTVAKA